MESILKFNSFVVEYLNYARKKNEPIIDDPSDPVALKPALSISVVKNPENKLEANVTLEVEFAEEENPVLPFYVGAKIRGFFEIEEAEELPDDTVDRYYYQNATAILFPYLRSLITDITSRSDHDPIILPPINLAIFAKKYIAKKQNGSLKMSESNK